MQGITLLEGDVWGHRKDIDEYYVVDEESIEEIGTLIREGESIEEATAAIQKKTKLPTDLIKYIARSKITA